MIFKVAFSVERLDIFGESGGGRGGWLEKVVQEGGG